MIPRHRIEIGFKTLFQAPFSARSSDIVGLRRDLESFFGNQVLLFQSGRSALYNILRVLPQKKVFVPAYTCRVVPEAVLLAGKEPVYVDIDLRSLNIDVADLQKKIVPDSVIIATHQFGIPCDIEAILELVKKNRCVLIEDCAAGVGSRLDGRLTGSFGSASIFSLEFTKVLAAGRGGFALINDREILEKMRLQSEKELASPSFSYDLSIWSRTLLYKLVVFQPIYGPFIRNFYRRHGFSQDTGEIVPRKDSLYEYGISALEAYVARRNLKKLDFIIDRRRELGEKYRAGLAGLDTLAMPLIPEGAEVSFMRFPLRVLNGRKKAFYESCLDRGIDLGFSFNYSCSRDCPAAIQAADEVVNLPLNSAITDCEADRIIAVTAIAASGEGK